MRTPAAAQTYQLSLTCEYDVVAMRQTVRQVARDLGLGLSQQAKVATAISTIARALIAASCRTTIRVRLDDALPRPALEIVCQVPLAALPADMTELEQLLHFGEARALVDAAELVLGESEALLSLRMWLSR